MDKIILEGEGGDRLELYILESTRLAGKDYILCTDVENGDGDCYILKDVSDETDEEACYEPVEDEKELDYVLTVFTELMDDVDIEFE